MRNNINNVVNISMMITVSLMINYLEWYISLLMAMSVIASYVILYASFKWDKVRRTELSARHSHKRQMNGEINRLKVTFSNTGTRPWRVKCKRRETHFRLHMDLQIRRDVVVVPESIFFHRFNVIYHLNRNIYIYIYRTDLYRSMIFNVFFSFLLS